MGREGAMKGGEEKGIIVEESDVKALRTSQGMSRTPHKADQGPPYLSARREKEDASRRGISKEKCKKKKV